MPSVRQWVLSVPKRLRYFMQRDGVVLHMVQPMRGETATRIGAVALIHRFGSSLNQHAHFHACVVDGVASDN